MEFDIKVFKNNYASWLIKLMYCELAVFVVAIALRLTQLSFFFTISVLLIGLIPIVILPLTFCYYIRARKQAERQRQWISNDKLYVERCFDSGLSAGGFINHKETVIFDKINSVDMSRRYVVVSGDINVIEQYNGVSKEKKVNMYRIPRVFRNEDEIINIGGKNHV